MVVEDAEHDPAKVFGSKDGRAALFEHYTIPLGWRPDGYDKEKADCTGCEGGQVNNQPGDSSRGSLSILFTDSDCLNPLFYQTMTVQETAMITTKILP